jgi:hypothetical protein
MKQVRLTITRTLLSSMLLALLFAAVTTPSADAWTEHDRITVYNGAGLCVQGDAAIDSRKPGVFSGNLAYATTYARSEGCGATLTKPDGHAAVRLDVYKWNGSSWFVCRSTDWEFGATGILRSGDIVTDFGPSVVFDYGGASACGPGYYGTLAHAYVWDGAAWRGGSVWSGYEYVP